jgi:tetratricopeptide (TPR) repeat protein
METTMTKQRIGTQIENLVNREDWKAARKVIEDQLVKEPFDHWLWARLSGVKCEQRDYQGAHEAAKRALEIVPDCPLAAWSYASAAEMLGDVENAAKLYSAIFRRGLEQLKHPNKDANECWEGPKWTSGLMADCLFQFAGCMAKSDLQHKAVEGYLSFISLVDLDVPSIYSRKDALARLKKLEPDENLRRKAVMTMVVDRDLIPV